MFFGRKQIKTSGVQAVLNLLVSIVINNYNYGAFLSQAVDSALAQSYGQVEVIVVDDGSTDTSRAVIAEYGERITAVLKANGGQASAFNAGFAASHGEIICFLDSDDLFLPDKAEKVAAKFAEQPEIGWCFDRVRLFDGKTGVEWAGSRENEEGLLDERQATVNGSQPAIHTATSGLSFRRETLAQILPMNEIIRINSDNYVKCVALALRQGWMDSRRMTLLRIHGNNAYTGNTAGKRRLFGRTELLTGLSLTAKLPMLRRLGEALICRGLGMMWATGGLDPDVDEMLRRFLMSLSGQKRFTLTLRARSWWARRALIHQVRKMRGKVTAP